MVLGDIPMSYLTPALTAYLCFLAAVLGLVFGSFCNAWAWRIVHHESIARGRSHCALCGHPLSAPDLVPLLSWLFLRGKCRYCGAPISRRYPAAEAVSAVFFVSVLLRWGLTWAALRFLALGCLLLVLSLVDLDIQELPDGLLLAAALAALLRLPAEGLSGLTGALLGAVAVSVPLLVFVLLADRATGRETMGGGDLKLFAALGFHFGPALTLMLLIFSCFAGLAFALLGRRAREEPFPFGPAVALAVWLVLLWGQPLLNWYLGLFYS